MIALPRRIAFADDRAEVVDGVQEYVFQLAGFGFDIARNGQVDHEDRPVTTSFDRPLDRAEADDR
jgi:hypothetical protein